MTNDSNQGFGAVIATGMTAQVLGGAISVVFVYLYHAAHPDASPPPEAVEQALGTIFTVAVSTMAMIGHLILRKYLNFTPS